MKKELKTQMEKAFAALQEEVALNPKTINEANALVRELSKRYRNAASLTYATAVASRKTERLAKREERQTAISEAKAAKAEAKAKFAAALAIKVNKTAAKKKVKTEKPVESVELEEALPDIF